MSEVFFINLPNGKEHQYTLKPSRRAKYIRIKLNNQGELSVTLPHRGSASHAHDFIQSKSDWVATQLSKLPESRNNRVPDQLDLVLLAETWDVRILDHNTNEQEASPLYIEMDDEQKIIDFSGNDQQIAIFNQLLAEWLKVKARVIFSNMLAALAEQHGFHYNRLTIRAQKTRWGSCSSRKNISLNCKLLFMPVKVVEYVMIHELCHTIHMNHSSDFWQLVEDCDPEYQAHRVFLKKN